MLLILLTAVVGTVSVARLTRLWIHDTFPPVQWLRFRYLTWANDKWARLGDCGFCSSPWITVLVGGWALWAEPWTVDTPWSAPGAWWLFNGWLAAAYIASIIMAYDEPE